MKKLTFIFVFVVLFSSPGINAQSIELGVKGGFSSYKHEFTLANISGITEPQNRYTYQGMHAGVFSTIPLGKRFTFQPEILYNEKGSYWRDMIVNFEMDYLDIPLLMRLNLGAFSLYTGPQFGFILEAREKTIGEVTESFNKMAMAAVFGFQIDFKFGLIIGGRYEKGLNDYSNLDNDDVVQFEDGIRNIGVQAYAGWKIFKLK